VVAAAALPRPLAPGARQLERNVPASESLSDSSSSSVPGPCRIRVPPPGPHRDWHRRIPGRYSPPQRVCPTGHRPLPRRRAAARARVCGKDSEPRSAAAADAAATRPGSHRAAGDSDSELGTGMSEVQTQPHSGLCLRQVQAFLVGPETGLVAVPWTASLEVIMPARQILFLLDRYIIPRVA
jgi:hypothetical protein